MAYPYKEFLLGLLIGYEFVNMFDTKHYSCFFIRGVLLTAIVLFSGCASVPETRPTANYSPMVSYALSLQGVPYHYGKSSPEEGFDCSGFVKHVYERQGISLPRTVQGMAQSLTQVPKNDLHSGDLVFLIPTASRSPMSVFMSVMMSLFMRLASARGRCWSPVSKIVIGENGSVAHAVRNGIAVVINSGGGRHQLKPYGHEEKLRVLRVFVVNESICLS